jgi:hypothetical protein
MNVIGHYRNQHQSSKNSNDPCPDLMTMAERELSAFFSVVAGSFGPEQAELSAQDWLRELVEVDGLPASIREWRLITAKASTHLADRVNTSSLATCLMSSLS